MFGDGSCVPPVLFAAILVAAGCAGGARNADPVAPASTAHADPAWQTHAAAYLDARATGWVEHPMHVTEIPQNFYCTMTCHTTHPFVFARPALPGGEQALDRVRAAIEARVNSIASWSSVPPMYGDRENPLGRKSIGAEAVMNASALVLG